MTLLASGAFSSQAGPPSGLVPSAVEKATHVAQLEEIDESFVPDPSIYESILVDTVIDEIEGE